MKTKLKVFRLGCGGTAVYIPANFGYKPGDIIEVDLPLSPEAEQKLECMRSKWDYWKPKKRKGM